MKNPFSFLYNLFISNENDKRCEYLAKLLSVGIYTDFRYVNEEKEEVRKILEKEFYEKSDIEKTVSLIAQFINTYKKAEYKFNKDKSYIIAHIIENNLWEDADYLTRIFKSDGELTKEECELSQALIAIVDNRRLLMQRLGLNQI